MVRAAALHSSFGRVTSLFLPFSLAVSLPRRVDGPVVEGHSREGLHPHSRESRASFSSLPFCNPSQSMMNGNARNERPHVDDIDAASLGADILNPFVHRLELGSTYEKLKVSIC